MTGATPSLAPGAAFAPPAYRRPARVPLSGCSAPPGIDNRQAVSVEIGGIPRGERGAMGERHPGLPPRHGVCGPAVPRSGAHRPQLAWHWIANFARAARTTRKRAPGELSARWDGGGVGEAVIVPGVPPRPDAGHRMWRPANDGTWGRRRRAATAPDLTSDRGGAAPETHVSQVHPAAPPGPDGRSSSRPAAPPRHAPPARRQR